VVVLCTNWCATICITCPILRKIECIKFVYYEFLLVLLQIDNIQFVLQIVSYQFVIKLIHIRYIQIGHIQFPVILDTWYKL
jgi:hypothetical protein